MDLQSRKIEFIQEFLKLQSENVISEFEKLLRKKKKEASSDLLNTISKDELAKRIKQSESDFQNGRYKSTNEILAKYKQ